MYVHTFALARTVRPSIELPAFGQMAQNVLPKWEITPSDATWNLHMTPARWRSYAVDWHVCRSTYRDTLNRMG